MFVVYSPEGQSLASTVQQIPVLRVDPSTRVNQIENSWLDELKPDEKSLLAKPSKEVNAYQQNKKESQHRVVVKVAEIMSEPIITINQEALLAQAYDRMSRLQIDYLPVLDDKRLIGLLSREQVLRKVIVAENGDLELGGERLVGAVMQQQIITTELDTDIRQVAQVFTQFDVGALVIMNSMEQPVGIVTRGDLVKRLAKEPPLEIYV
ncbi:CBS domain-containing protein [Thiomicrorhabdus sp. 6S2-11]|uniref:CBS domain-containing protein n=1 Tax=Thiomicrorhabdus marina TaxID=2818442 RepID=A0ABS3Q162_9GAMM|nr:CBS domain-containing protein [Thiomicrorhabdus marina]MBO1926042.1 CBS domain-containing protein [Thiomicrorhabdus marina]